VAISGVRFALLNGATNGWTADVGPYEANGHRYAPLLNTSTLKIEMYKWTNGTGTPAVVDSANSPTHTGATHSYGSGKPITGASSHLVHVARRTATNTIRIRRFNLNTEVWEAADVGPADATTIAHTDFNVTVGVRSDGDILLYWRGSISNDCTYSRWEGASWAAPQVTFATQTSYPMGTFVTGDADQAFTFMYVNTNNDVILEPLNNANTRGTQGTIDATASQSYRSMPGYALDGATHRTGMVLRDSDGTMDFVHHTVSNAPGAGTVVTNVAPAATTDMGLMGGVVCAYNAKWYAFWSGDGRGEIHMDSSDDLGTPAFTGNTTPVSGLAANDPGVCAMEGTSGIALLYNVHTATPSVELVWPVGAPPSSAKPNHQAIWIG
jgi:hypothetical protein